MPPPNPKVISGESLESLETEGDFEETLRDEPPVGILEESMVGVMLLIPMTCAEGTRCRFRRHKVLNPWTWLELFFWFLLKGAICIYNNVLE